MESDARALHTLKSRLSRRWIELSDEDLKRLEGTRSEVIQVLCDQGMDPEDAVRRVDQWLAGL